jgi:hypothetical protein
MHNQQRCRRRSIFLSFSLLIVILEWFGVSRGIFALRTPIIRALSVARGVARSAAAGATDGSSTAAGVDALARDGAAAFVRETIVPPFFVAPLKRDTILNVELFHDTFLVNDSLVFIGREPYQLLRNASRLEIRFPGSQQGLRAGALPPPAGVQSVTSVEERRGDEPHFVWRHSAAWLAGVEGDVAVELRYSDSDAGAVFEETWRLSQRFSAVRAAGARARPRIAMCAMLSERELHLVRPWTAYWLLHGIDAFNFYVVSSAWTAGVEGAMNTAEHDALMEMTGDALRDAASVATVRAPFFAHKSGRIQAFGQRVLGDVAGLPVDVSVTEWNVRNFMGDRLYQLNPHFMMLTSCYQRHRLENELIAFFDLDEYPIVVGAPNVSFAAFFAPLAATTWLTALSISFWGHLNWTAALPSSETALTTDAIPQLDLAHFTAPIVQEARDAGSREKYVVNTREARRRNVQIVNNHGVYAHNWNEQRGVPPKPGAPACSDHHVVENKCAPEHAYNFRLPVDVIYHVHLENLKGAPRWPLKDPQVVTRGVADHIVGLLAPCDEGGSAIVRTSVCESAAALRLRESVRGALDARSSLQT